MPQSPLRLIKTTREFLHESEIDQLPDHLRGIYVLYKSGAPKGKRPKVADVVYIGLARQGMKQRLRTHRKDKAGKWSHASVFEVWDNIRNEEIVELEGLFRHIYRKDTAANRLNHQGSFKLLKAVAVKLHAIGESAEN